MKKLILVLPIILAATELPAVLSDGSSIIFELKNQIKQNKLQQSTISALTELIREYSALIREYSALTRGIGPLAGFMTQMQGLITFAENKLTDCASYETLQMLLSNLFSETGDGPLQQLLKHWDQLLTQPNEEERKKAKNFIPAARNVFIELYKKTAALYLKLKAIKIYKDTQVKEKRDAEVAALDDIPDALVPENLASDEFKKSVTPQILKDHLNKITTALESLIQIKETYIRDYCALQEEYYKQEWRNNHKYWKDLEGYAEDAVFDDLFLEEEQAKVYKNYRDEEVLKFYQPDIQPVKDRLSLWVGPGNDILAKVENKIKDLEKLTPEQEEAKALQEYKDRLQALYQKYVLGLLDYTTFGSSLSGLKTEISQSQRLSPEAKAEISASDLYNNIILKAQKDFTQPLISYLAPQASEEEILAQMGNILEKKLIELQEPVTNLANANKLRQMQAYYFTTAKDIYNLILKDKLPGMPSPQDSEYRDIASAYIGAANLIDTIQTQLASKQVPTNEDLANLSANIQILQNTKTNNPAKWQQLLSWLPGGQTEILEKYDELTNKITLYLTQMLNELSVELLSLKSLITP